MYPTLWKTNFLGTPLDFHAYTFFLALAFLVGTLLPVRQNYRLAQPYPVTPIGGIWVFFGALLGAKMYYQVQYGDPSDYLRVFRIWEGGLVFYGGLFGGIAGALLYCTVVGAPKVRVGDMAMPFVPLAHAVARLGCLLNGCCWGARTDLPWAIHYPTARYGPFAQQVDAQLIPADAVRTLGVHPTQIYESLGLFVLFLVMRAAWKRPHHAGQIMLLYPLGYGMLRFMTEATRGDSARPLWGMTASQLVALGFIAVGLCGTALLRQTLWRKATPQAPEYAKPVASADQGA